MTRAPTSFDLSSLKNRTDIFFATMDARIKSLRATHKRICSSKYSTFSFISIDPYVSTWSSTKRNVHKLPSSSIRAKYLQLEQHYCSFVQFAFAFQSFHQSICESSAFNFDIDLRTKSQISTQVTPATKPCPLSPFSTCQ